MDTEIESPMQHILIVDDDPSITYLFARVFRLYGYRISEANSGTVALNIASLDAIDGVITDFKMLGMNGHELIVELQKIFPCLPSIVVSAYTNEIGEVDSAIKVISKPIHTETLVWIMREMLEEAERKKSGSEACD